MLTTADPSGRIMSNGKPARGRKVDHSQITDALQAAGLDGKIKPDNAVAIIYPDAEAFASSAEAERISAVEEERRGLLGNEVHGPFETPAGLMGIIDMTLAILSARARSQAEAAERARRESSCYNRACMHQGSADD